MNRNGLLILIAVLMALALVIRIENAAQAQIIYEDSYIDPETGLIVTDSFLLGNSVRITLDSNGRSLIWEPQDSLDIPPLSLDGRQTDDRWGTVFTNSGGGIFLPSTIHAGSGVVISNVGTADPAIRNGGVDTTTGEIPRIYGLSVTRVQTGAGEVYMIQYGYYLDVPASDPRFGAFVPLPDYDELPEAIQDLLWYEGGPPLFAPPAGAFPGSTLAISPADTQLLSIGAGAGIIVNPDLPLGTPQFYQYPAIPTLVFRSPILESGEIVDWHDSMIMPPPAVTDILPPEEVLITNIMRGVLTINDYAERRVGDQRALIQSSSVAIENRGILTVNHARIQAGVYGIWHEYSRTAVLSAAGQVDYGASVPGDNIYLYNTQIGLPSGGESYEIVWDPNTGQYTIVFQSAEEDSVIELDPQGRPVQVVTTLYEGDKIADGRISVADKKYDTYTSSPKAGPTTTLRRNPLGLIYQDDGEHHWLGETGPAEMQRTRYDIFNINGPSIGIWARLFGIPIPGAGLFETDEDIYRSIRYSADGYLYSYTTSGRGLLPTPSQSLLLNRIELNDNSWIFANSAGISFGGDGIGIFIDDTSGIYARDYGITDRYSLRQLYAIDWRPTPIIVYQLPGALYSGSYHEIHTQGKVIAGSSGRAGIRFSFDHALLSNDDKNRLSNVYYYDPYDEDADDFGNVYYYDPNAEIVTHDAHDPERNARVAEKFIAYNNQPNRIFWLRSGNNSIQLTYYDYAAQRWMVNPAPGTPGAWLPTSTTYPNSSGLPYFTPFDESRGIGIEVLGTSMLWEGVVFPAPGVAPWTTYYGPTVRQITVLGDDALVAGGSLQGLTALQGYAAAIFIGDLAHVSQIVVGENRDVKNLSDVLFFGSTGMPSISPENDLKRSADNFHALDTMTSIKRSKLLYNPDVLFSVDPDVFHFDNAGVHGDIISFYNAVVTVMTGGDGTTWDPVTGNWIGEGTYSPNGTIGTSFWVHGHPGAIPYYTEILDIDDTPSPSLLLGHRDGTGTGVSSSAIDIPGVSLVLDEILLNYIAGQSQWPNGPGVMTDSYGYADNPRHFREALSRYIHYNPLFVEVGTGLYISELLEGYTRDGTLVVFTGGDIFSGNIYGSGIGDPFSSERYFNDWSTDTETMSNSSYMSVLGFGNIDLRFKEGTTVFNRNIMEWADGSRLYRDAGIRVRDVYVEKTGHLLLNDAAFAVNPFANPRVSAFADDDYADRLIIHDVLNEGIVSGNGVFMIAQRYSPALRSDYFEGYFINRGVLAPGLPGFIGENEQQAINIEKTAYDDMLSAFTDSSKSIEWDMRGVPGGQFGAITIFGSLYLMDEHTRPVFYDPNHSYETLNDPTWNGPLYNTLETLAAGEYHVTISNDTIGDVFGKYAVTIRNAHQTRIEVTQHNGTKTYVYNTEDLPEGELSKEDWQIVATEKLRTQLSWFSPSAMVDSQTGLPLLTEYEQFEYLTDDRRRTELQRQMLVRVLTANELQQYDSNPVRRAALNQKLLTENNIRFELTQLDTLLMRFGFSDVVSVHGTIPPYVYDSIYWSSTLYDLGSPSSPPSNADVDGYLGLTQLGGIIQADRIYDLDSNAAQKEKQTSYIIIASEGYTDGTIKQVTSATTDWVFANVSILDVQMASGQFAAVLTVIDDKNYYRNRVRKAGDSHNAQAVANALDDAMFTNPGLAQSFNFGLNSPETLNNVFRQVAGATRANSLSMNLLSPSDHLFNRIGYGVGGMSTGRRGDIVFRNMQTGQLQQPYGQPGVPPPGQQFAPPMAGQTRGQSPFYRTGSVWGAYTHSNFAMADDRNSFKYTYYRNGVMIGNEWNLTPSAVLGGVAMVSEGTLQSLNDKVKSQDYTFGFYFVTAPYEQFEVKSFLGFGYQSYKSDRYIRNSDVFIGSSMSGSNNIFGINDHYDSETQGYTFNYAIEFARPFTVNPNFVIRPAVGGEYQSVYQKGYTERLHLDSTASWVNDSSNIAAGHEAEGVTSGSYAMRYRNLNFGRLMVRAGFTTESYFARGGLQLRAYQIFRLAGDRAPHSRQSFASGSKEFTVRGGEFDYNQWQLGAGTHIWLNQDRTATFFFDGDWNFSPFKAGYSKLGITSGIQISF